MKPALQQRRRTKRMSNASHSDPAERSVLMRLFYHNWRPTRLGRWINRFSCWWSGLGLPPRFQAALEVRGRTSGRRRSNPVVVATVEGKRYLVSMLGPDSDWGLGEERRSCAWRSRYSPRTSAPRSPRRSTAGKAGTYPSRVRANRVERPAALPATHRRAAFGLPSDRRTLSCVSDRTRMKRIAT